MRLGSSLLALWLCFVAWPVFGAAFKPYPEARISKAQWQQYYREVSTAPGVTREDLPELDLVIFEDAASGTRYTFTQPGHPAHPAWIARRLVRSGESWAIDLVGYYAGKEAAFSKLFDEHVALNERIRQDLERRYGETP